MTIFTLLAAQAATLSVPGTYGTIDDALQDAQDGDVIEVAAGSYPEDLVIDIDVSLVGTGGSGSTTISGSNSGAGNLLRVDGATFVIEGFTLEPDPGQRALGITDSEGTVTDLVVTGASLQGGDDGAAIGIVDGSTVSVVDSTFEGNTVESSGGHAFVSDATATFSGTVFRDGLANRAGAVAMASGSTVTFADCEFLDNEAEGDFQQSAFGGAVAGIEAQLVISNSRFEGNAVNEFGPGGAVALYDSTAELNSVTFLDNFAGQDGGTVLADNTDLVLVNAEIDGGIAGYSGGALHHDGGSLSWMGGTLTTNEAEGSQFDFSQLSGSGGGLWLEGVTATLEDLTVEGNVAQNVGGAFYALQSAVTVEGWTASDNEAAYGGVGYISDGVDLTSTDTTFSTNSASESGGVFRWRNAARDGSLTLTGCTLSGNTAGAFGGGLAVNEGGTLSLVESSFEANTATDGGAVSVYGVNAEGLRNTFCANTASNDGGGLRAFLTQNTTSDWAGNVFVENTGSNGGGVFASNGSVTFRNNHFLGNSATSGGGIRLQDAPADIVNNLVAWTASGDGIRSNVGNVNITYNDFWDNTQDDVGGALGAPGNTNLSEAPELVDYSLDGNCGNDLLYPNSGSPLLGAGDPNISNSDGSPSDIGAYGGPDGLETPSLDSDNDGFETPDDCDDTNPDVNPDATEVCDGIDNDCDGTVDGVAADDATTVYVDTDGDGYGDAAVQGCEGVDGVATDGDCDDSNGDVYPGAEELCDGLDNDCNGVADDGVTDVPTWYADGDQDGFGDPDNTTDACVQPPDTVDNADDCNDLDGDIYPGADETCDGVDEDCDGTADNDPVDPNTYYADNDGDGFGGPDTVEACEAPDDYLLQGGDCNDDDTAFYPGAPEACDATEDFNCDGSIGEVDADNDGWIACEECDDSDPDVNPDADETWYDGIDQDCDGASDFDQDGDGHDVDVDCDDTDPSVRPGAEIPEGDGVDQDCDGVDGGDADVDVAFEDEKLKPAGCGCTTRPGTPGPWILLGLVGLLVRRRR